MTSFEALYGVKPKQICLTVEGLVVEEFQVQREAMNKFLKESIQTSQNKYKQYAYRKRQEASYDARDWVFLRLQPCRQLSVAVRKYLKLAHKYFGPYQVLENVVKVAYILALPQGSKVHPVFHISLLKRKAGSKYVVTTDLPKLGNEGKFLVYPVNVLQTRSIKKNNAPWIQWLVQWLNSSPEDAAAIVEQYPDFQFNSNP